MEITAITAALESLKSAADIASFIRKSDLNFEKAEAKLKLADLISALAEARIQVADIQTLLLDKDETIRNLQEQSRIAESLSWRAPCYWRNESGTDFPYCQNCYDTRKLLVRLQSPSDGFWECHSCQSRFMSREYLRRINGE